MTLPDFTLQQEPKGLKGKRQPMSFASMEDIDLDDSIKFSTHNRSEEENRSVLMKVKNPDFRICILEK